MKAYWWTMNVRNVRNSVEWNFLPAFAVNASNPEDAFTEARIIVNSSDMATDITGMWRAGNMSGEMKWSKK